MVRRVEMNTQELSLIGRIHKYHDEDKPEDGRGCLLLIKQTKELFPGVVAVLDSLNEMDLFVDVSQYELKADIPKPYTVFKDSVKQAFSNYRLMAKKYSMICIVEDRWFPFFGRKKASFEEASLAAEAYLEKKL